MRETSVMESGRTCWVDPWIRCSNPSRIPNPVQPEFTASIVAAEMTELIPGAGPPPHRIPSLGLAWPMVPPPQPRIGGRGSARTGRTSILRGVDSQPPVSYMPDVVGRWRRAVALALGLALSGLAAPGWALELRSVHAAVTQEGAAVTLGFSEPVRPAVATVHGPGGELARLYVDVPAGT